MKKEELFETLQNLDDELIREAEGHVVKKSKNRKLYAYASIAAVFMLALIAGVIFREKKPVCPLRMYQPVNSRSIRFSSMHHG